MERLTPINNIIEKTAKKHKYAQIKGHDLLTEKTLRGTFLKKLLNDLLGSLENHEKKDVSKIEMLEKQGTIRLIGYTFDKLFDLVVKKNQNINTIKSYEKLTEMLVHLIYICKMEYGVNFALNKKRKTEYIYLRLYNNHSLKPFSSMMGSKLLGKVVDFNNKNDPKILIKGQSEFFRLSTATFLWKFFPELRKDINSTMEIHERMKLNLFEEKKTRNPFKPKHKPRPKA